MNEKLPTILLRLDVSKIEKDRLFRGEKGIYLDAVMVETKGKQFGDVYVVIQQVTKEERLKGVRGKIIGNAKFMPRKQDDPKPAAKKTETKEDDSDSIPF